MVIVILGVVGAMVAVFMKSPVDAYFATARRVALADAADLTVRRIARDLRTALPNSVGPSASAGQCIEFIPTKAGGRYLADDSGNAFKANTSITGFNVLGPVGSAPSSQLVAVGDYVAVYNLGITGADAYAQNNVAKITSRSFSLAPTITNLQIVATTFPLASGSKRVHVIPSNELSAAYVCDLTAGTLTRRSSASFQHICGNAGATTSNAVLAKNVSACSFDYSGVDLQRNGLVNIRLALTDSSETVSLVHEVHVSNTP